MIPRDAQRSTAPRSATRLLIFDGDCGLCTSIADWCEPRLPANARAVPWQRVPDLGAYGLSSRDTAAAAYWIDERGVAHRGHRAAGEALRAIGGAWGVVGDLILTPPFSWVAAPVYAVVSRVRHRLPGSTPACRR